MLWFVIKNGFIGFLERTKSVADNIKLEIADRLFRLWSHPSTEFIIGFLKGLVEGLWDGITGPFVLLWDLVKFLVWLVKTQYQIIKAEVKFFISMANRKLRHTFLDELNSAVDALEAKAAKAIESIMSGKTDPMKILAFIQRLIGEAAKKVQETGAWVADAVLKFFRKKDRELGQSLGYVEGLVLFEVILLVLTEGGYTALKEALQGLKLVARLMEAAAQVAEALSPVRAAVVNFGRLLRSNAAVAGVLDAIEGLLLLLIKYFKFSYGLGGAGKKAAGARRAGGGGSGRRRAGGGGRAGTARRAGGGGGGCPEGGGPESTRTGR